MQGSSTNLLETSEVLFWNKIQSIGWLHPHRRSHHSYTWRDKAGRRWRRRRELALRVVKRNVGWRRRRHPHRHPHRHRHDRRHDRLLRREPRRGRGLRQHTGELALIGRLVSRHGRSAGTESDRGGRGPGSDGQRVVLAGLRGEEPFGGCSVPFALAVLFEGVLDGDGFVHEELAVHGFDGGVGGFKVGVGDEPIPF